MFERSKYNHLSWLLLLVPVYVFLFVKLGSAHIRLWDEAWFAVHAVEMMEQGSWFVSYFDGEPSVTSSKPPLQTWMQIGAMKLIGINALALRIPSALAAALTVLLIFFTSKRIVGEGFAWISALVLLTSIGFIGFHTARGAEADALLTLFLSLQAIAFFSYAQQRSAKWLWALAVFIVLGFWAKSVATFLFLPGMLLYALIGDRALIPTALGSAHTYGAIVLAVAGILLYVLIREYAQPGYISMFFKSNVGRYTRTVGHDQPLHYYIRHFLDARYAYWIGFAAIGAIWAFINRSKTPAWVFYSALMAVSFLMVISFSRSKLPWYDMPFYPMAAVPVAFALQQLLQTQRGLRRSILLIAVFLMPAYQMFAHTQANRLNLQEMAFEAQEIYLSKALRQQTNLHGVKVVHDHFKGALLFYQHCFENIDQQLLLTNSITGISAGDRVLVANEDFIENLQHGFHLDSLDGYRNAILFQVRGPKHSINNQSQITK